MSDWLVVLSDDNWAVCRAQGLLSLGRNAESRLNRMSMGDKVWVYVNRGHVDRQLPRIYEIRAVVRVSGPVVHLAKSPWKARGNQRFTVARPIVVEQILKLKARDLLMSMSFAGRPPGWGLRLLHAPLLLTAGDVAKLKSAATSQQHPGDRT
jgi:hypothetical protein